jgi:hypothetical protein
VAVWAQQREVLGFVISPVAVFVLDLDENSACDGVTLGPSATGARLDA